MKLEVYPPAEYGILRYHGDKPVKRLTKDWLQKVYIDMDLSRKQVVEHCGITLKMLHSSYNHHFTAKERDAIGRSKLSLRQKTHNSNSCNTGKPRVELDKETLELCLSNRYSVEKMGRIFKVAPQTVRANIEYLGLADRVVRKGVPYEEVIAANAIDKLFGTEILKGLECVNIHVGLPIIKATLRDIVKVEQDLTNLRASLVQMRRKIIARMDAKGVDTGTKYRLPMSILNSTAKSILSELGYETITEFELDGKFFDFKVRGWKLLIEIDSLHYHHTPEQLENDRLKTKIAEEKGYTLIRVMTGRDKRVTLKKKIQACLNQVELKK